MINVSIPFRKAPLQELGRGISPVGRLSLRSVGKYAIHITYLSMIASWILLIQMLQSNAFKIQLVLCCTQTVCDDALSEEGTDLLRLILVRARRSRHFIAVCLTSVQSHKRGGFAQNRDPYSVNCSFHASPVSVVQSPWCFVHRRMEEDHFLQDFRICSPRVFCCSSKCGRCCGGETGPQACCLAGARC